MTTSTVNKKKQINTNLPVSQTLLSEVLKKVLSARGADKKVEVLKKYDSPALRTILLLSYARSIQFDLPPGNTPYKPNENPEGINHQYLFAVYKDLERFITKTLPNGVTLYGCSGRPHALLGKAKKEMLWIQLLEALHNDEAQLLDVVKDKQIHKRYQLTRANVIQAFPELKLQDEPAPVSAAGRKKNTDNEENGEDW
jgi:hypothetical protein